MITLGKLIHNKGHWKIYRQNGGMGETVYVIFLRDIFLAQTDNNKDALIIIRAWDNYVRLP